MKLLRYQRVVLLVLAVMSSLFPTVMYASDASASNSPDAGSANHIYLPLVASPQQTDDVGVFQVFEVKAESQTLSSVGAQAAGVCIRTPFGPGWVNWKMSNPGQSGYKYSVKPETSVPLIWAQAPSQGIDGIYKASWGSCTALKIPDSCTVDVNSDGTIGSCCNAAAALAGHVVKWTNTCSSSSTEASWPDNPLQ